VTAAATDESPFAPAAFFAQAARALGADAASAMTGVGGDHVLNPGLIDEAGIAYTDAAVLIPVVAYEPEARVILTVRTGHLSAHAGQIALPGGKVEAGDADPVAAALREAGEEIGLDRGAVTVIGTLNPYLSRTGYRIVPVLARVEPGTRLDPNRDEVADVFEVPLGFLMTPANHKRGTRAYKGHERYFYEMPFEGRYIWGVTAGIIHGLYEQVYG
jgi:8-oxo-dGTP pyrophosphatase MutT (NUDIX family)